MSPSASLESLLNGIDLEAPVRERALEWLGLALDPELRAELEGLIRAGDAQGLHERFSAQIDFGTGGMRGPMGVGINRMNHVMIARATQGMADHMRAVFGDEKLSAVVCYDARVNSRRFAEACAETFAGNGIRALVFRDVRPTPLCSFAVRELDAQAGVMITASHNPKEDNGFKAYWDDGAQVIPPHDNAIVERVKQIGKADVKRLALDEGLKSGAIAWVGPDIDEPFYDAILKQRINRDVVDKFGDRVQVVFTPLHGVGGTMIPEALRRWGFRNVVEVESQAKPDGTFPTVRSANPEDNKAFDEALKVARAGEGTLVLASDPDCDRVGAAVRLKDGSYRILSGNEICALLCYYILNERKIKGKLPEEPFVVKTIVTTDLISIICRQYSITLENCLTGFKWIAERIRHYEELGEPGNPRMNFVYGCEESIGYLAGSHTRDKDAVVSSCLIAEMAAWCAGQGKTLADLLDDMARVFGIFIDSQVNIYREGLDGQREIAQLMERLRAEPPASFLDEPVYAVSDFESGQVYERQTGDKIGPTNLPKSNVLMLQTDGGSQVVARPSGTEPKVKFYFSSADLKALPIADEAEYRTRKATLEERHERLRKEFRARVDRLMGWESSA